MKAKNCLIFGGSGQIGRNLIRKLAKNNYKVTVITRNIHTKGNFIKTGIVTSKDKVRTLDLIEYFQLNFEIVVTPDLTEFGKPSSQPILLAAKNLKLNTNEIIFVGDMESDMICALNSNCHYLHYKNGYQNLDYQIYGGEIYSIIELKI